MAGFFKKLFGGGKKEISGVEGLISNTLQELLDKGGFELSFEIRTEKNDKDEEQYTIEMSGADEELLKEKEGQLIESFQLLLKRVVQHHFPEDRSEIFIDCNGYREESSQALVELAEKLKNIALEKGKSVYFRALPPKDRKVIHQYLASDDRVKSRSIGDGLFKKIKIYPAKGNHGGDHQHQSE